jgi:hypothetical protein
MHMNGLLIPKKAFNFPGLIVWQCLVGQLVSHGITSKPLHLPESRSLLWRTVGFNFVNRFDRGGHLGPKMCETVPRIMLPLKSGLEPLHNGLAIGHHFHRVAPSTKMNKAHGHVFRENSRTRSL